MCHGVVTDLISGVLLVKLAIDAGYVVGEYLMISKFGND